MRIGSYEITSDKMQWIARKVSQAPVDQKTPMSMQVSPEFKEVLGQPSYHNTIQSLAKKVQDDRLKHLVKISENVEEIVTFLEGKLK